MSWRVLGLAAVIVVVSFGASRVVDPATSRSHPSTRAPVTHEGAPTDGVVEIVAHHDRVEYDATCGNESVAIEGTTYYPLYYHDVIALHADRYPTPDGPIRRVTGTDAAARVGTMIVYGDGIARFRSDDGSVIWLTDVEQTYGWEC